MMYLTNEIFFIRKNPLNICTASIVDLKCLCMRKQIFIY